MRIQEKPMVDQDVVSIIIPCYNGERFLDRLFHTLLRQTYKKVQILFADDGSEDGTRKLVEIYCPRFEQEGMEFQYLYQENKGLAAAINLALPHVSGEYCMWFDVDDFMDPKHVEKKVSFLREHPECDIVMCTGDMFDESDLVRPIGTLGEENAISTLFEDLLLERRRCTQGLYMVKTQALMKALPNKHIYDSNRRMGQNMQLLLPVTLKERIGYIEDKLFHYVVRGDSLSHANRKDAKQGIAYREHVQDIKEHVIKELPISESYLSFLGQKLSLYLCLQKMDLLDRGMRLEGTEIVHNIVSEYIGYASIRENRKQRDIIYWGKCGYTEKVAFYLEEYAGLHKTAFVDSNIKKCDGKDILFKESICKKDMYLIVPLGYHEDIVETLMVQGFKNHRDFFYPQYDLREKFKGKKCHEVIC